MTVWGTVELGGTKTLVAVGNTVADVSDPLRLATGDPVQTLSAVADFLGGFAVQAVGVGSFGPVELRLGHENYGRIIHTPKPRWSSVDVVGTLGQHLDVPIGFDTDVNAAALGEWKWGATRGLGVSVYLTVGTGIGGGVLVDGRPLRGLPHPEMGHTVVERHSDDGYPGGCPFHKTCLEGMASGPAIAERFGQSAMELEGDDEALALELVAYYLAQGLRNIIYSVAPERIVIGGGVSQMPGFHGAVRAQLVRQLGGYPGVIEHQSVGFVVEPGLGSLSGLAGGLVLAELVAGKAAEGDLQS